MRLRAALVLGLALAVRSTAGDEKASVGDDPMGEDGTPTRMLRHSNYATKVR